MLPHGSRRRYAASRFVNRTRAGDDRAYQEWIRHREVATSAALVDPGLGPLISVIVPAFNTPDRYLEQMITSVLAQTYGHWELCLVDGCTDPERSRAIQNQAARDPRIHLVPVDGNRGIAGNTNAGIERARGDYIAFLDHDDVLAPFALNEVAAAALADPAIDVFYSDEDFLAEDGRRRMLPFFKPGWSPELFLCVNYLAHFVVARTALVRGVGGIREGYEGAQDYDFLLRAIDQASRVHHIARVSYHWRQAKGSTARRPGEKRYAEEAGCRAIRDHLEQRGISAKVSPTSGQVTNYHVRYPAIGSTRLHIAASHEEMQSLKALLGPEDGLTLQVLHEALSVQTLRDLPKTDYLLIVEIVGHPVGESCLGELVGTASQPGVGVVAPALITPEGAIRTVSYVAAGNRLLPVMFREALDRWTRLSQPGWARNLVAVGGMGVMTVGLASELLAAGVSADLASFSVAAYRRGLRNVYWPFAQVITAASMPSVVLPEPLVDPYLNPNAAALTAR